MARITYVPKRGVRKGMVTEPRIGLVKNGKIAINKILAEMIGVPCKVNVEADLDLQEVYFTKAEQGISISKNTSGGIINANVGHWLLENGINRIAYKRWDEQSKSIVCSAAYIEVMDENEEKQA